MTTAPPQHPGDEADADVDDAFAVTIADELLDAEDPEAVPGAVPVDERPLQSLPTIGYVGRYALKYQLGAGGLKINFLMLLNVKLILHYLYIL